MHSLIHNQLSAPAFEPLIKYAWFKAGYLSERVKFSSVLEICFSNNFAICSHNDCSRQSFIQCSWCFAPFCFDHFFYTTSFSQYKLIQYRKL